MSSLQKSNRIWFGFYRHPELVLQLKLEPIISDKLVEIELVNQVIERRIKEALEEFVILPNMDSFAFMNFDAYWNSLEDTESNPSEEFDQEFMDTKINSDTLETSRPFSRSSEFLNIQENLDEIRESMYPEDIPSVDADDSYLEKLGHLASRTGRFVRETGIDDASRSLASTLSSTVQRYGGPWVEYLDQSTRNYRDYLYDETVEMSLRVADKLGLKPDGHFNDLPPNETKNEEEERTVRKSRSSRVLDIMGVSISTLAPNEPEGSPSVRRRKLRSSTSALSLVSNSNSNEDSVKSTG